MKKEMVCNTPLLYTLMKKEMVCNTPLLYNKQASMDRIKSVNNQIKANFSEAALN